MSDLETRIAEVADGVIGYECKHQDFGNPLHEGAPGKCHHCYQVALRIAAAVAPVIAEAKAEALREAADLLASKGIIWWGDLGVRVSDKPFAPPHVSLDDWLRARADSLAS